MTPEKLIDFLASQEPCCSCCDGDSSYADIVLEVAQHYGVEVEQVAHNRVRRKRWRFDIVVAVDTKKGIGFQGKLPWPRLKGEMRYFKELTTTTPSGFEHPQNVVIMGRKTFESIGGPLPGRLNIVVSRTETGNEDIVRAPSLDAALEIAESNKRKTFVIGGAEIYKQALEHPARGDVYMTVVDGTFEADTFWPGTMPSRWSPPLAGMVEDNDLSWKAYKLPW